MLLERKWSGVLLNRLWACFTLWVYSTQTTSHYLREENMKITRAPKNVSKGEKKWCRCITLDKQWEHFSLDGSLFHHFLFVCFYFLLLVWNPLQNIPVYSTLSCPHGPPSTFLVMKCLSRRIQILPMLDHLLCLCFLEFLKHDGISVVPEIVFFFSLLSNRNIYIIDS